MDSHFVMIPVMWCASFCHVMSSAHLSCDVLHLKFVVQVNASDDRSTEILRDTISRAMSSNTIFGEQKPNCIILDEIDGIDGRAPIDMLVSIITAPLPPRRKASAGAAGAAKGKKAPAGPAGLALTRPLICICNDHFAPALRELKNHAALFVLPPPGELRLVQRLKAICGTERLSVSGTSLAELCQATGNDIRSSINTLQFAALRTEEEGGGAEGGDGWSQAAEVKT